jgi:type I restriction enzyme S subunit
MNLFLLRVKNEYYKPFIYLMIKKREKYLKSLASGTTTKTITKNDIKNFLIPLPPLKEQEKIAKILSTWDRAIEKQEELIKAKERLKKGLMQKLLTGKVRFKGFSEEWKEVRLGEITKIYDGTHQTPKYTKKGIPFYSVENITSNNFGNTKYISEEVFEKEKKRVTIEKGDILLTRIGDIGTSKYVNWEVKASFYVSLALIKHSKNFNSLYLKYFFDSVFFQKELYRRTLHIAFPKKINLNEISKCKVILPPLAEQQKIAKVLSIADREIELLKEELEQLKKQKKGLMQRLLSGEVRVKV